MIIKYNNLLELVEKEVSKYDEEEVPEELFFYYLKLLHWEGVERDKKEKALFIFILIVLIIIITLLILLICSHQG